MKSTERRLISQASTWLRARKRVALPMNAPTGIGYGDNSSCGCAGDHGSVAMVAGKTINGFPLLTIKKCSKVRPCHEGTGCCVVCSAWSTPPVKEIIPM